MGRPKQFDPELAVEQAMQVFWRKGYASTTPQDLIDALGIGKGSLYNAFGSKHALFERALKRYRESQADALAELLARPGPVKERLRTTLAFIAEMNLGDPDRRGCLAVNTAAELASSDPQANDLVSRMFDRTEEAFRAVIEEGQRTGEISSERDAQAIGSLMLNTVVGLQLLSKTANGPERLARVIDALLETF
ncbi:TetR/AcrR family transcriptional regulator [Actinomadura barringtoniae]|uniref:TetR/AcrR family transcriptional regulator n=1 Tax=Actinomadura barringtoniae TaxID=1427535 RepID=A0A939T9C5_9ACTN|nr:TetR/AcrR family transcriptional regulator [Actinomadura barringtoniae]MBO2455033.1 TetR/AcrR family transcriptional regulator [Actinomadura barringtoniae]